MSTQPQIVPQPQETSDLAKAQADWQRPVFHFRPPAFWLNDPNGTITLDGWHHVFYQYCPGTETEGPKHWGHARSRDLVDWEHLDVALSPDASIGEQGVWSGGAALAADGNPVLVYTSFPLDRSAKFRQVAVTCDRALTTFTRVPGPLLACDEDPAIRRDARDPFLFQAEGKTWMIHGCERGGRSVVLIHEVIDGSLLRWRPRGELISWPCSFLPFPECPNLMPLDDGRWLLLLSPFGPVEGFVGRFHDARFTVEGEVRLDQHDCFYATNVLDGADGKPVLLSWVRHWSKGRGWNGCLAAPRRVHAEGTGIRQEILPGWLEALAAGGAQTWSGGLDGDRVLDAEAGDQLVLDLDLRRDPGAGVVVELGRNPADGGSMNVVWRGDRVIVAGQAHVVPGVGDHLDLRILVDRSLIEIFANGGRTVITRIAQRPSRGSELRLCTTGPCRVSARWQRLRAATFVGED